MKLFVILICAVSIFLITYIYYTPTLPPTRSPPQPTGSPARRLPQPEAGCALAYDPFIIGSPDEGYKFGARNDSHIRYAKLPGSQLERFNLTITFRTSDEQGGLIYYASTDEHPRQFLAVYMRDGLIYFSLNCGRGTGIAASSVKYNNNEWHSATILRNGGHAKLSIDSVRIFEIGVTCSKPSELTSPFYGGLRNMTETISDNLMGFYQPFKGCLKGLMMSGQYVTDIQESVNALRCARNFEDGIYFGPSDDANSNYLKLQKSVKAGHFSITMQIKPRNSTGLLLSVHGEKDFMILELLEDEVVLNGENSKVPFYASYKLGNKFSLCDGNWHTIIAWKQRPYVSLGVDGHFSDATTEYKRPTNTSSALYIGGHEQPISELRGVRSRRGFTGCIRIPRINYNLLPIPLTAAGRNTHIGACPTD